MNELGTVKHDYKSFVLKMLDERNRRYYNRNKPQKRYDRYEAFTINPK